MDTSIPLTLPEVQHIASYRLVIEVHTYNLMMHLCIAK